jgi:hypothetical protein
LHVTSQLRDIEAVQPFHDVSVELRLVSESTEGMLELAKTLFGGDADVNWRDKARLGGRLCTRRQASLSWSCYWAVMMPTDVNAKQRRDWIQLRLASYNDHINIVKL